MKLFKNAIRYFYIKNISRRLKKRVNCYSFNFLIFQELNLPEEDLVLADELRGISKYKGQVSFFDDLKDRINNHNSKVLALKIEFDKIILNHSKETILSHIDEYNIDRLRNFNQIALSIGEFTLPDSFEKKDSYLRYMRDLGEIIEDYTKILEQYSLIKDFKAISFSFEDVYLDKEAGDKILEPARSLLEKVKAYGTKYYEIPFLDEKIIERHNEQYIQDHLCEPIFDDVNGKCLDEEQRRAVLCDPKSNLTIAGAGAGKTLTICGKVKWLLHSKKARTDEILLLSYSKASAEDLASKAKKISENLKVKTFHSLGLEILNHTFGRKRAIEEQLKANIARYFQEELIKDPETADRIFRFFSLYLYADTSQNKKYKTDGERFEDLKASDFRTLKDKLRALSNDISKLETLQKEYVKSYEELVIANFLFVNGIHYEYERAYEIETSTLQKRQYTPDFYLKDYDIYLEHYGIDKDGRAPQYSEEAEKEYLQGIKWKREIHAVNQTTCLETYSYEFQNGQIFENLKNKLIKEGIELKPLSQEEILDTLHTIYKGQEFSSLLNLITSFLSLYKAQYPDENGFEQLKSHYFSSVYDKNRAFEFLEICKSIYSYYVATLHAENKIDFDDMILQSISALDQTIDFKYKYVIVDEFQDISQSRAAFLKKIISHGNSKLFAVGDDWQAIYRFAGCDINIFLHFSQYFDDSKINFITTTHRNSKELQSVVEPFIMANPEQYIKHMRSELHQDSPVHIIYHDKNRLDGLTTALRKISKIDTAAEVLILGRNRKDIDSVRSNKVTVKDYSQVVHKDFPKMNLLYKTVHQAKGLESNYVILISGENAKNGFPNKMEDDDLLNLVLSSNSKFEFAEERRLFYVALTRTRSVVYILSDSNRPSLFVREIENRVKIEEEFLNPNFSDKRLCPWCKTGKLILRKTKWQKDFYGCSNFPYCRYVINDIKAVHLDNRCPDCGDFLVVRESRYGKFLGCHNYPRCKYTRQLKESSEDEVNNQVF